MSTHPNTPPRRRSRHELRLEQIAIWGDAAAAYGRSATTPTATSTLRTAKKLNAQPLDLGELQSDLVDLPEAEKRSGSLSMCHSHSADVFRRSGKHGAVARASMKGHGRDVAAVNEENDHVVIKRGGVLGKGSYRVERGEARGMARRQSEKRHSDRRQSERRQSERRQSDRRQSEKKRKDDTAAIRLKSRRDSKEMRERDENDFRLSNAKLPERVDEPRGGLNWAPLRRRRSSVPILGRYTRSRSSQLPSVRPKSLRPFQSASSPS